ncbi:MAG: MarC family protein [Anaerolineaceae bacterium]
MNYWQLSIFFFAAINPAAIASAMARHGEDRDAPVRWLVPAIGVAIAAVVYGAAAFGAKQVLDGLDIEPESFRVAAGIVMAAVGTFVIWRGAPDYSAASGGLSAAVFPLALPLLVSPAGLVAVVTYGADDGGGKTFGALVVSLAIAAVLLILRPRPGLPALDAVARITGTLLVVVAAGLVVDGVRSV